MEKGVAAIGIILIIVVAIVVVAALAFVQTPETSQPITQEEVGLTEGAKYEKFKMLEEEGKLTIIQVMEHELLDEYIADKNGMTLYLFTQDTEIASTCFEECAVTWPPFLATRDESETLKFRTDTLSKNLNLFEREPGVVQHAFGNSPLYYYVGDEEPGDVNGHNVDDVWFVIPPGPGPKPF